MKNESKQDIIFYLNNETFHDMICERIHCKFYFLNMKVIEKADRVFLFNENKEFVVYKDRNAEFNRNLVYDKYHFINFI